MRKCPVCEGFFHKKNRRNKCKNCQALCHIVCFNKELKICRNCDNKDERNKAVVINDNAVDEGSDPIPSDKKEDDDDDDAKKGDSKNNCYLPPKLKPLKYDNLFIKDGYWMVRHPFSRNSEIIQFLPGKLYINRTETVVSCTEDEFMESMSGGINNIFTSTEQENISKRGFMYFLK